MFDADELANQFLASTVEGPMATERKLVPEGVYLAVALNDEGDDREWMKITAVSGSKHREEAGREIPWLRLNIPWKIHAPDHPEAHGRIVRQSFFVDLVTQDAMGRWLEDGDPSFGKVNTHEDSNVRLGRLRAAVGQNEPGPWSPKMVAGQQAMVSVRHNTREVQGEQRTYAEVSEVAAASEIEIAQVG
jgi:hypothetical protein